MSLAARPVPGSPTALPVPERSRRRFGLVLFYIGVLSGVGLLALFFLVPPLFTPRPGAIYLAMIVGALFALPAGAIFLTVPRLLDRYDPEPLYALWGCVLWGGLAACGFSAAINSLFQGMLLHLTGDPGISETLGAVVSAPLVEEVWKGFGVFGVFYFLRREFDGVVDGIIYATYVGLGFATVENVVYYSEAAMGGSGVLAGTVVARAILSPWVHPVFTAMTGFGFGLARESEKPAVRGLAPVFGFLLAVFLHFVWNGSASLGGNIVFLLLLPLWALFLLSFLVLIAVLVRRFGAILRAHLLDEVALGTIDQAELDLVCSAFGVLRARLRHGKNGEAFVRTTARLGLSKWHTARAMKGNNHTISMGFIGPLRERIARLKAEL